MSIPFIAVEEAIEEIRQGNMIILVDDEDRENEGDLVIAAEKITPEAINFMATFGRCPICLPMAGSELDRLQIPMMVKDDSQLNFQTAFTVTIEAAKGVTTGVSAHDRAHTIKVACDPNSGPTDVVMPGHIFPLRAKEGGVLARSGHTEGSVDLASLADLRPAAVICEVMNDDGTMARLDDLVVFAKKHNLKIAAINDLIAYRRKHECLIEEQASCKINLKELGEFTLKVFKEKFTNVEHVTLVKGEVKPDEPCLVRVHSECLTGDVFGSTRCDCGWQLKSALATVAKEGGVVLYMSQEGRGIGLANKIKAYALQNSEGFDTVEANLHLGFSADHRDYGIGSQILSHLGITKMRLLTNNPRKIHGIGGFGIDIVSREPIEMVPTKDNISYLQTKRNKMGHLLDLVDVE